MQLNDQDAQHVAACVENEGFDYCFRFYSHFPEIKDKKFQKLRKAYIKAAQELSDYARCEEEFDEEIDAEESAEAAKVADEVCDNCGDTLDEQGWCGTCDAP